jgi:uncharacterized lipoprotein YajG
MRYLFICAIILLPSIVGCAFASHKPVVINPKLSTEESAVGQNQQVCIRVVDERLHQTLGTRGVGDIGAEISVEEEFPLRLQKALTDGLRQKGFRPVDNLPLDGRELRVEIRNLDYKLIMGFWAGTLRTECNLKAYCVLEKLHNYEKLFRGEYTESVQIVQTEEANQRYINTAVSNAINALLQDERLMHCLATPY